MIDVDPTLAPLVIDGRVLNEMCAHALETWPEECCGLVTGKGPGSHRSVHRCRNDMTLLHRGDPVRHPRDGRAMTWRSPLPRDLRGLLETLRAEA